jgi:ubiquinone/menaquinone biosynthesis C-methylase UbiE
VLGVDISSDMLALARQRTARLSLSNVSYREGRAEDIPAVADSVNALLASLCLMYAIDREAAAGEIARVLRGRGGVAGLDAIAAPTAAHDSTRNRK